MAKKIRRTSRSEFKPDPRSSTFLKTLRMTQQQRLRLLKWGLYVLSIVLALVIQNVIMSRVRIFGTTTDLPVCVILLIAVLEGTEVGSVFVLLASLCYYFSGTAPNAYAIGMITFLGIAAVILRQMYWNRSRGAIVLCAGLANILYELALFAGGMLEGLTHWGRLWAFALCGVYSALVMIPLYPLMCKIGQIGGNTWKE